MYFVYTGLENVVFVSLVVLCPLILKADPTIACIIPRVPAIL